jgi:hypothetical protein
MCETVEHVHVLEVSDFEHSPSPGIMFGSMGFGSTSDDLERKGGRRTEWLSGVSGESVQMVADSMRLDVAKIISTRELAVADEDLATESGVVRKGSVAG